MKTDIFKKSKYSQFKTEYSILDKFAIVFKYTVKIELKRGTFKVLFS